MRTLPGPLVRKNAQSFAGVRPPGAFLDIAGAHIYVRQVRRSRAGFDKFNFVIEAGCGWHSAMYVWLAEALASRAPVLLYDRSGLGWSSPATSPPDAKARAAELGSVIDASGLEGPFVLIGHSIAALYLRVFAHRFREKVAGLVFLDPSHHLVHRLFLGRKSMTEHVREWAALAACEIGLPRLPFPMRRAIESPWNTLPDAARREIEYLSSVPMSARTAFAEWGLIEETSRQAQACGAFGALPLLIVSGAVRSAKELEAVRDPELFMDKWMLLQRDHATLSSQVRHRIIAEAGHCSLVTDKRHADQVCEEVMRFVRDLPYPIGGGTGHV